MGSSLRASGLTVSSERTCFSLDDQMAPSLSPLLDGVLQEAHSEQTSAHGMFRVGGKEGGNVLGIIYEK